MMIIEFVGLPGVGKTTLCKKLCSISDDYHDYHNSKTYFEYNWLVALNRHYQAFMCLFRHPLITGDLFNFIWKSQQRSFNDFRAVFVNFLYKYQLYRKVGKDKIYVLDEGILHSLFSIIMSSENDELDYSEFVSLLNFDNDFKWVVVKVNGENIEIIERFKNRSKASSKSHRIESERFEKKISLHQDRYFNFIEKLYSNNGIFQLIEVIDSSEKSAVDLYEYIKSNQDKIN